MIVARYQQAGAPPAAEHQYLREVQGDRSKVVREISTALMNSYRGTGAKLKRQEFRSMGVVQIPWITDKHEDRISKPFAIGDIEAQLLSAGCYDPEAFDLYAPSCSWLDPAIRIASNFHMTDANGDTLKFHVPWPVKNFPLSPLIDREGWAISSFQTSLATRIIALRRRLVTQSNTFDQDEWLQDFRALVSECVSLIDITLHQLYWKAQCDPLPGWTFDKGKLGPRHGRNLRDKLRWVGKITGIAFNAQHEVAAFMRIKALRNHLQHFDPSCFALSLEEVAEWLSLVPMIGQLARKIRDAIGSPLSLGIIELMLLQPIKFYPLNPEARRVPLTPDVGYASVCLPLATGETRNEQLSTIALKVEDIVAMLSELHAARGGKTDPNRLALASRLIRHLIELGDDLTAEAFRTRFGLPT